MGTSAETIAHLLDHLRGAGIMTARKMFGEYALYLDSKGVAFVCDDQLFVKPSEGARLILGDAPMAPAYPGSKLYYLIDAALDDLDLMHHLLRRVAEDQPPPKPKAPRKPKASLQPKPTRP